MAYKALYRIYRPQTFDEVVGQKHILRTLQNAIKENKIAHAYLFTGPRGTGKTTMAKLLAKGVNCTSEDKDHQCNECPNCKAIAEGSHPDVIEIDAASNNGVDEVRDLVERVKYAPIEGRYKVYIIDEVHMMTSGAFNALLKTLEEPPAHVIFILATTEVHKVLPTILSRCQRFDFGRVSVNDMKRRIEEVLESEKVNYEDGVVNVIASLADGGMRDALAILDQAIAYAGTDLTVQHIRDIYGIASIEETIKFIDYVVSNDVKNILDTISEFDAKGIDIVRFTSYLIDIFKEVIILTSSKEEKLLVQLNSEQAKYLSKKINIKKAFKYIDVLIDALSNYKKVNTPKAFFELAALKMSNVKDEVEFIPITNKVEKELLKEVVKPTAKKEISVKKEVVEIKKEPEISIQNQNQQYIQGNIEYSEDELLNMLMQSKKEIKAEVQDRWSLISNYQSKPAYKYACGILMDANVCAASSKSILLTYDIKSQANILNSKNAQIKVREFIKELFNEEMVVYGLSNDEFKKLTNQFIELRRIGMLPEIKPIVIKEIETSDGSKKEKNEEKNELEEFGNNLFGSLLEVEE